MVVAGTLMAPGLTTFTVAVASGMFVALAWRTVVPAETPVIGVPTDPTLRSSRRFTVIAAVASVQPYPSQMIESVRFSHCRITSIGSGAAPDVTAVSDDRS